MKNKKGQSLGGLYSGILIIAAIGILLALVLYVLSSMGTSFLVTGTGATVTNETGLSANTTTDTVAGASATAFASPNVTAVWASLDATYPYNTTVPTTNVSISSTGIITNATTMEYNNISVSYTYTYSASTSSSDATDTLITQFVAFLPWLGIILLVLAAGVVLFFVIRSFAGGTRGV